MTIKEIERCLNSIRKSIDGGYIDYEVAHSEEDILHISFIKYVADNYEGEIAEKAKLVLSSTKIKFPRYCS